MPSTPTFETFWAEQDAFIARRNSSERAAAKLLRKETRWEKSAAVYLRKTPKLIPTKGAIRISAEQQRAFFDSMQRQAQIVNTEAVAAFDKHLGNMALTAAREWPVDTGLSRAALTLSFSMPSEGVFAGTLRSGAPYTAYINRAGTKRARAEAKAAGVKFTGVGRRLPPWKAQFLRQVGSRWEFDEEAYNAFMARQDAASPDRKPAKNSPYPTYVRKPSKPVLVAISEQVKEAANRGKV